MRRMVLDGVQWVRVRSTFPETRPVAGFVRVRIRIRVRVGVRG